MLKGLTETVGKLTAKIDGLEQAQKQVATKSDFEKFVPQQAQQQQQQQQQVAQTQQVQQQVAPVQNNPFQSVIDNQNKIIESMMKQQQQNQMGLSPNQVYNQQQQGDQFNNTFDPNQNTQLLEQRVRSLQAEMENQKARSALSHQIQNDIAGENYPMLKATADLSELSEQVIQFLQTGQQANMNYTVEDALKSIEAKTQGMYEKINKVQNPNATQQDGKTGLDASGKSSEAKPDGKPEEIVNLGGIATESKVIETVITPQGSNSAIDEAIQKSGVLAS